MKTTYEELLDKGLIRRVKQSPSQVRDRLALAKRDIKAAKTMMATDRDWAFSMAYNAVLQATRSMMLAKGYRAAGGEGQHKVTVMFAEITLGEKFQDDIYIFNKMRSKRHRVIYDVSGLVSQPETRQAFQFAVRFVKEVEALLRKMTHEK
jgi:uncharacterized protein (UPF0332 family)